MDIEFKIRDEKRVISVDIKPIDGDWVRWCVCEEMEEAVEEAKSFIEANPKMRVRVTCE